jgi:hypothetical protein
VSKSHKKKRNVGLLYEFLVGIISKSLIDGNKQKSARALKIVRKHFKPGTELYKEFRLMNSIRKTIVSSEAVAASILQEAKTAARGRNLKELDRQKSLLIHDINHMINDENFYDQQVNEYKLLATTQTLLNDWRQKDCDLSQLAMYEEQIIKHLTRKPDVIVEQQEGESNGSNRLLMKVMMKKLNEKYAGALTPAQVSLVRAYAFSTATNDDESIKLKLVEMKNELIKSIDQYKTENEEGYLNEKLTKTREQLLTESLQEVNDDTVTRFMLYAKLSTELKSNK